MNATTDPLTVPASDVKTPVYLHLMHGYEPRLFFDGDRFMRHLDKTYKSFDIATYSMSRSHVFGAPLSRICRLIHGLRQHGVNVKAKEKRYVQNNHVKLFICYSHKGDVDIYVGSQNLTHGTNLNLMVIVSPELVPPLVSFFNSLWENAI